MQTLQIPDDQSLYLIEAAIERERRRIAEAIRVSREHLQIFETKHKMASETFYAEYEAGKAGEDLEIMQWAAEYRALRKLMSDHRKLSLTTTSPHDPF
jgi:vacuolar-type H+-ATPase subunit H